MADENKKAISKLVLLGIITVFFFVAILSSIGYDRVRSASPDNHLTQSESVDEQARTVVRRTATAIGTPDAGVTSIQVTRSPVPPTAEATVTTTPIEVIVPDWLNPSQEAIRQTAIAWDAEFEVLDQSNTGIWQFGEGNFLHPIAIEIIENIAYLIDGGRVLAIDLQDAQPPRLLLSPGDTVGNAQVLEPLDLVASDGQLLVLDRAGDVYGYALENEAWELDRYDRPVETSSGHYFVAIAADQTAERYSAFRALLETNYKFAQQYRGEESRIWRLPERRAIDLSFRDGDVFILQRELHEQTGTITKYRDTSSISAFAPRVPIEQPRQLVISDEGLYVLDQGGRRLLLLDPAYGQLIRVIQLPQEEPVSAVAIEPGTGDVILAGRDRLYFAGQLERRLGIPGSPVSVGVRSHDTQALERLDYFIVPIGGSNIAFRDFQLPGAPRHYRLGIHSGLDLYWQPGTKVLAAADGVIIRADHDYVAPSAAELDAWSAETHQAGHTSAEILNKYMGQQVWIEHAPGIVSRYAHLRTIDPKVIEGTAVSRGQVIGEVGNSGSPASLESESADAHLHFELWLGYSYLGQYLRPIETRDWIEQIFPASR